MMKKNFFKEYWWIVFCAAIILIPIALNWIIRMPAYFKFVGNDTDWLNFWVSYISAIASFAMVLITWRTLKQNENQLNELKRQWDEENRPRLEIYFVKNEQVNKGEYIEVLNIGKRTAYDIELYLDEAIITKAPNDRIHSSLRKIGSSCSLLLPNESFIINLCQKRIGYNMKTEYTIGQEVVMESEYNKFQKDISSMESISISGRYNEKYKIRTKFIQILKRIDIKN